MPDGKGDPTKKGQEQKKEKKVVIKKITPLSVQQKKDTFQRFEDGINQQNKVFRRSLKITVTNQDRTNKVVKIVPIQEEIECVTYHIYWNSETEGKIEKHIPKQITEGFEDKYQYVYHDKEGKEYDLGFFEYYTTNEILSGNRQGANKIDLIDARQFKGYISSDKR